MLRGNDEVGKQLWKLFNTYHTNETAVLDVRRDKIALPQRFSQFPEHHVINLIDEEHIWKPYNNANLSQSNDNLIVFTKSNKTDQKLGVASLDTELTNSRETPLILALEYGFEYPKENADFIIEIRERGYS